MKNEKFIVSWWCVAERHFLFIFISIFYNSEMLLGNTRVRVMLLLPFVLFLNWSQVSESRKNFSRDFLELWWKRVHCHFIDLQRLQSCMPSDLIKYSYTPPWIKFHHYENRNNCWLPHLKDAFMKCKNKRTSWDAHFHNKQRLDNCFSHVMREKFPPHDLRLAVASFSLFSRFVYGAEVRKRKISFIVDTTSDENIFNFGSW